MATQDESKMKVALQVAGGVVAGAVAVLGLAHVYRPPMCQDKPQAPATNSITTHYWNGRGLMELPRQMMKATGVVFTDGRHSEMTGDDKCNLGRMPNIAVDGFGSIGQSAAINFYIASQCNLLGDNSFEAAKCIELGEHLSELRQEYLKIVPWGSEPTEEALTQFFEGGGEDSTGTAQNRGNRFFKWFVGRIENSLTGTDGFAVGNRLSLADFFLFAHFHEHLTEAETDKSAGLRYPFGSKDRVAAGLANCPKILASIAKVAGNEGVINHLATRGPQAF